MYPAMSDSDLKFYASLIFFIFLSPYMGFSNDTLQHLHMDKLISLSSLH